MYFTQYDINIRLSSYPPEDHNTFESPANYYCLLGSGAVQPSLLHRVQGSPRENDFSSSSQFSIIQSSLNFKKLSRKNFIGMFNIIISLVIKLPNQSDPQTGITDISLISAAVLASCSGLEYVNSLHVQSQIIVCYQKKSRNIISST